MKTCMPLFATALLITSLIGVQASAQDVLPGVDLFESPPGYSHASPVLPADFFGPGSDPFTGTIDLRGKSLKQEGPNLGRTSTIVERLAQAVLPAPGTSDTVPIRIIALRLVSVAPITVTYDGGLNPEEWDVQVCLSSFSPQLEGEMTIYREYDNGGTFQASLPVTTRFTFTRKADGMEVVLDPAPMEVMQTPSIPPLPDPAEACWSYNVPFPIIISDGTSVANHDCNPATPMVPVGPSSNFVAGGCGFAAGGLRPTPATPPVTHRKVLDPETAQWAAHGVQPTNPLDHFKVYDVDTVLVDHTVALQDQFDTLTVDVGPLVRIDYFANPVDKNDEQIADKNAHLVWYRFISTTAPVVRRVRVNNQFGEQWLKIGRVEYLLVPAEKFEEGSEFPINLDHFKCYRCLWGDSIGAFVTLQDQFDYEEVTVERPVYFCNPVSKNDEGIISDVDHLVFYKITPPTVFVPQLGIDVGDQFGQYPLAVDSSLWLGVPSEKLEVTLTAVGPGDTPPVSYALYQNIPNPFNPTTTIRYDVPAAGGQVTLRIYDVRGRLVRTLVDGREPGGAREATWDARNARGVRVASGIYFYRLKAPGFDKTRKMVLLQ